MKDNARDGASQDWKAFVLEHGWRASTYYLGAVIGQHADDVEAVKRTGAVKKTAKRKTFAELFVLWHGRPPVDSDWPIPLFVNSYEWQPPEIALLATLVGQISVPEISRTLTARLRKITGDPEAERNRNAVLSKISQIGLQAGDLVGGLTTKQAGKEIGTLAVIHQAIEKKQLKVIRVGHRMVIPYDEWEAWKASRVFPPKDFVRLTTLKEPLSIRSDKLSEFARAGYIPTAIRCNPLGTKGPSTQFGTWWIDPMVAKQLVADRRAGKPMPWHGQVNMDNLKVTYRLWRERKHPATCETCRHIWGEQGAPRTFEEYVRQYPPIAHGAKRHLTMKWSAGLTLQEVAEQSGRDVAYIRRAIAAGMMPVNTIDKRTYISRTDVTRWIARKCPSGEGEQSWMSFERACNEYFFSTRELRKLIRDGQILSKTGTAGDMRGIEYVVRQQCVDYRAKHGFTREEAARRLKVTLPRLEHLLEGANWRGAEGVPLWTLQALQKRLQSHSGYTIEEAAKILGTTVEWVMARKNDGTFRVSRAKWDQRRLYVSEPMLERLRKALAEPTESVKKLGEEWLLLSDAALEAGVSITMILRWADAGELSRRKYKSFWRYHREAVRARAREYWRTNRFRRPDIPTWVQAEIASGVIELAAA